MHGQFRSELQKYLIGKERTNYWELTNRLDGVAIAHPLNFYPSNSFKTDINKVKLLFCAFTQKMAEFVNHKVTTSHVFTSFQSKAAPQFISNLDREFNL